MKKILLTVLLAGMAFRISPLLAQIPAGPEFSAELRMMANNAPVSQGKIHRGQNGIRMEMTDGQVHILRTDKNVMWMTMPGEKSYMEMKMPYNALVNYKPEGFSEECQGSETLDGRVTQKCRVTGRFMGQSVTSTVWKAQDLGGIVLKSVDDQGNGMEIKNVVTGPQPPALFEPPAGYQKMALPVDMEQMMKGMTR